MVNFKNLSRPKAASAPINPFEIFSKTPNLNNAPNDLWKGQAEALKKWHDNRTSADNIILLNTGAGKSIVGVLIAQGLVNEAIGPVVFACSTIDLVEQTARECERLGLKFTKRTSGAFSNDLFETGKAFCITTYQALFVANSSFKAEKTPAAIIFDDAHVGERTIRDVFTLSISKERHAKLYKDIVEIVRPEFERLGKGPHLDYILESVGQAAVTMCPPTTAHRHREEIIEAIKRVPDWRKTDLFFSALRLWEHIGTCAIFLSANNVEITPPFIPTGVYNFFGKEVRRVYLSATMEFETDFVRGFGRRLKGPIIPDNDAGNGERLILLGSRFVEKTGKKQVAAELLTKHKLVISVPSYPKAAAWKQLGEPPKRENFTTELQTFRDAKSGAFILVSRIDGIDLPQDTCRVMLIDGAPTGSSLMEQYLSNHLTLTNLFATKMAGRITQLLGRINRGRADYSAFLVYGNDINNWLKTERNVALLPPLIRKQVILSQTVQDDMSESTPSDVVKVVSEVLSRDPGWLEFYRETVDGLEVSSGALEKVKQREAQLAKSAQAECEFMTRLWQGDHEGARTALLDVLDDTALVDAKLAGWYSVWLAMDYDNDGDVATSVYHYKRARSRLSHWLNVPHKSTFDKQAEDKGANNTFHRNLLAVNLNGPQALGNLVNKLKIHARTLGDPVPSANAKEEALRSYGELLGYAATRPDNELGHGPDVVWKDEEANALIAFELKTEKKDPAEYSKTEVGQAHNHIQWIKDNEKQTACDGLLLIGPPGVCKPEASPSDSIYLVATNDLVEYLLVLAAKIDDTRGRSDIERWHLLSELGTSNEWQLAGLFKILAKTRLASLKDI